MKKCNWCGAEIEDSEKYCQQCKKVYHLQNGNTESKTAKGNNMNMLIFVFGIIVSLAMILTGAFIPVPSKEIDYLSYSAQYVGGDAYNYIIESSIRGGQISGMITCKTILISLGILLFFLVIIGNEICKSIKRTSISPEK